MASDIIGTLKAVITADVSQLTSGLAGVGDTLQSTGQQIAGIGASLTLVTAPITAFLGASLKAASDQQTAMSKLQNAIKNVGGTTGVTMQQATGLADSLDKVTRFSNTDITSAEALIATYKNISSATFPQALTAATDLASAMGTDLPSAAKELGIALDNPATGFTRLQRAGVTFSASDQTLIKSLAKTGDIAGADKIILAGLESKFKDSATAAGDTFAGKTDILNHSMEDLQIKVGNIVMSLGNQLLPVVSNIINSVSAWIDKNPQLAQTIIEIAGALAVAGPVLLIVGAAITALGTIIGGVGAAIGLVLSPIGLIIAALLLLKRAYDTNFLGFKTTVDNFVSSLQTDLQLVPFYFQYFLGKIEPIVRPVIAAILTAFNGLVSFVTSTLVPALGQIYQWFTQSALPAVVGFVQNTALPAIQKLFNFIGNVWALVSPALTSLGNWFLTSALPAIGRAVVTTWDIVSNFFGLLGNVWNVVGPGLTQLFNWFSQTFLQIVGFIQQVIDKIHELSSVTASGTWSQGATYNAPYGTSGGGGGSRGFGGGDIAPALNAAIGQIGGFAGGGSFSANQLIRVGENGPELVQFGQGGSVIPNGGSGGYGGGYNGTIQLTLQADGFQEHLLYTVADGMAH